MLITRLLANIQASPQRNVSYRKNKNGEFPIYIVVCFKGRLEKSTGVSCLSKYWDSKREVIKVGCPNAAVLNKMLSDIKNRVIERRNEFETAVIW